MSNNNKFNKETICFSSFIVGKKTFFLIIKGKVYAWMLKKSSSIYMYIHTN